MFKELHKKLEEATQAYIEFSSPAELALWKEELLGQISDGAYENTPDSNWEYWADLPARVGEQTRVVNSEIANDFPFAEDLLDVVGDRMLEIIRKFEPEATEEDLGKMLNRIQLAVKGEVANV